MADPITRATETSKKFLEEQKRRAQQGPSLKKKLGRRGKGGGMIPKKEDSSVTLGKFMKAKVDALNESVKAGGMKRDRILEGSNMRSPKRFIEDVEAGKYKNQIRMQHITKVLV